VALILVLWFIVLLAVLALGLSKISRNNALIARQLSGVTQARQLAEGGVQMGLANLLLARDDERLLGDGEVFALAFQQGDVELVLWNESGKININQADEALLARLFEVFDVEPEQSTALAAAIADWRDDDDLVRLQGAENEDYLAAGLTDGAGNRAFTGVTELRKVLGMEEKLYQQIEAYVTIYSKQQGINPEVAPLLVLLAVSDADDSVLEHYIKERRRTHRSGLPLPPAPLIEPHFLANDAGAIFTVSARATTAQNMSAGQHTVFELVDSEGRTSVKKIHTQAYALTPHNREKLETIDVGVKSK